MTIHKSKFYKQLASTLGEADFRYTNRAFWFKHMLLLKRSYTGYDTEFQLVPLFYNDELRRFYVLDTYGKKAIVRHQKQPREAYENQLLPMLLENYKENEQDI